MNRFAAAQQMIDEYLRQNWAWRLVQSGADPTSLLMRPELRPTDAAIFSGKHSYTLFSPCGPDRDRSVLPLFETYQHLHVVVTLREDAAMLAKSLDNLRRQYTAHQYSCWWEVVGTLDVAFTTPGTLHLVRPIHLFHFVGHEGWSRIFAAAAHAAEIPALLAIA